MPELTAQQEAPVLIKPELGAEQMTPIQLERRLLELRMLFRTDDTVVRQWAWDEFRKLTQGSALAR